MTAFFRCGEMSELAEGARLEIVCTAKSGTEGSNPSLSAIFIYAITKRVIETCDMKFLQENGDLKYFRMFWVRSM